MMENTSIDFRSEYAKEIDRKDRIIRYLTIEVIKLGGGDRCPLCNEWSDIETDSLCHICSGLGFYLPDLREEDTWELQS